MKKHIFGSFLFLLIFLAGCSPEEPELDLQSHTLPLGLSAESYLSADRFTSLTVEIIYVEGFEPPASSIAETEAFLRKYLHKPEGIEVIIRSIPAPGLGTYSLDEVRELEDLHRTVFTSGRDLATYIFIADDSSVSSTNQEKKLGTAYRNTSMVIYGEEISNTAINFQTPLDHVLHTVIRHEFGHLLGLVNNGSDAQADHEDQSEDGRAHCSTDDCLMEAKLNFSYSNYLELDSQCQHDLVANGGKV